MPTTGGGCGADRQGAVWLAVRLSVALDVVQDGSRSQAGVHETTRQESLPTQATFWLHCPYRKVRQPVRRLLQSPLAHSQVMVSQSGQKWPRSQPAVHRLHSPTQSM